MDLLLERVRDLSAAEQEYFYKQLGQDSLTHFYMFENYPIQDFKRVVKHIIDEVEQNKKTPLQRGL